MGAADAGVDQVGGGCPNLEPDILSGGSVGPVVWIRDVRDDTAHWGGIGRIPPQGGLQADWGETLVR